MDLNYNNISIFPSVIHQFDVNGFDEIQNQLIDYAYEFKNKDPEGVIYSNHGGWQSPNFDIVDENDLLHSFLINCLSNFPNIDKSINFEVDAWININKKGDYNEKHNHPNSLLSGCIYLHVPDQPSGNKSHGGITLVHREARGIFKNFDFCYNQSNTRYNDKDDD